MIAAIVAIDNNYGIGSNGDLLMHIPEDMKMFKELTTDNMVIMGRKTWDSLPVKPLSNRWNHVVTSYLEDNPDIAKDDTVFFNMQTAKIWLSEWPKDSDYNIYVIGGGMIYKELLSYCDRVYVTKILHAFDGVDTFFPNIDEMSNWRMTSNSEVKEYNGIKYQFCVYDKI